MIIPEGYEKLAVIGIAYKGAYVANAAYKLLNAVYYEGSTYVALKDNPVKPPIADGVNWQYLAKGFLDGMLSAIDAVDTSGLIGTAGATVDAQILIDDIADRVATKLLLKNQIVNNLLATIPGNALDAMQGKALSDRLDQVNSDLKYSETQSCTYLNSTITTERFNYVYSYGDSVFIGIAIDGTIAGSNLPFAQIPAEFAPSRESHVFGTILLNNAYIPADFRITDAGKIYQVVTTSKMARAILCGVYTKK